jgi:phosphate ABC transporter phosphate-binding protein
MSRSNSLGVAQSPKSSKAGQKPYYAKNGVKQGGVKNSWLPDLTDIRRDAQPGRKRSRNLHRALTGFSACRIYSNSPNLHRGDTPYMSRMLLFFGISLCVGTAAGCGGTQMTGAGSTFVYPMMSKWSSEYDKARGIKINYQSIGSGGGIQQMTAKTVDFGCTDGPMNEEQLEKARAVAGDVVHIPLVMGAVVPAYNLAEVTEQLKFTGPVLADIYLGKIKKWNDKALKDLNPKAGLPDKEIVVVHRSEGSGTTYIWVDYLSKQSSEWKKKVGVGTSVSWPCGIGQKGNEAVAGLIRRSAASIGYVELTYALQNDIKYGVVKNKAGEFVNASLESVTAAANAYLKKIPDDLRYSITDPDGKDVYPISGTVWAVVYVQNPTGKGKAVRDFLHWVTHEGQQFAAPLHYSRLPEGLVKRLEEKLDKVK